MIVNLDSASGAADREEGQGGQGVKTIDYDRLTLGGGADSYVSFDNVKVGELQGQGLAALPAGHGQTQDIVELDGSPTDNNATLFQQGCAQRSSTRSPSWTRRSADQAVPNWDNQQAATIFEQMLTPDRRQDQRRPGRQRRPRQRGHHRS